MVCLTKEVLAALISAHPHKPSIATIRSYSLGGIKPRRGFDPRADVCLTTFISILPFVFGIDIAGS